MLIGEYEQFVVTIEHVASGRRLEIIIDARAMPISWPSEISGERLEALARGRTDPAGEYQFCHRAAKVQRGPLFGV